MSKMTSEYGSNDIREPSIHPIGVCLSHCICFQGKSSTAHTEIGGFRSAACLKKEKFRIPQARLASR
jgi:hypothetical protein